MFEKKESLPAEGTVPGCSSSQAVVGQSWRRGQANLRARSQAKGPLDRRRAKAEWQLVETAKNGFGATRVVEPEYRFPKRGRGIWLETIRPARHLLSGRRR